MVSDGTPYLAKKPCSLATHSGRTRAFTAAWAMTLFAGADAASRALTGRHSASNAKLTIPHRTITCSFPKLARGLIWIMADRQLILESQRQQVDGVFAQDLALILRRTLRALCHRTRDLPGLGRIPVRRVGGQH